MHAQSAQMFIVTVWLEHIKYMYINFTLLSISADYGNEERDSDSGASLVLLPII
jgi:hypothetical protein